MTDYTAIVIANNAAALAEVGGGGGGVSSDDLLAFLGMPEDAIDTFPRSSATGGTQSAASGDLLLGYFTPLIDFTVSNISAASIGATPSSGLTLARMGLYTAAANGDATLVARTASDTTLFDTINTVYTRPLATAGGYPATYDLVAGTRYAVGILQVGTTASNLRAGGPASPVSSQTPITSAKKTGQTDIAGDVASVTPTTVNTIGTPWVRLT